jgi:hypothetical protein
MPWTQEGGCPHPSPRKGDAAEESRAAATGGDPSEVRPAGKWWPERGKCELQTQLHFDAQKLLDSAGQAARFLTSSSPSSASSSSSSSSSSSRIRIRM